MEDMIHTLLEAIEEENLMADDDQFEVSDSDVRDIKDTAKRRWDLEEEDGLKQFSEDDLEKYKNILNDTAMSMVKETVTLISKNLPDDGNEFFDKMRDLGEILTKIGNRESISDITDSGIRYGIADEDLKNKARETFGPISPDALDDSWEELKALESDAFSLYEDELVDQISQLLK